LLSSGALLLSLNTKKKKLKFHTLRRIIYTKPKRHKMKPVRVQSLLSSSTFFELQLYHAGRSDIVISQRVGIFDKDALQITKSKDKKANR